MSRENPDQGAPDSPDDLLAAEYVLHLLDAPARRAAEGRLDVDGAFRASVAAWSERLIPLTDDIAPVPTPPMLRARLVQFANDQAPGAARYPRGRTTRSFLAGLLGGGALAALAVTTAVVVLPLLSPPESGPPRYAADVTAPERALVVAALFDPGAGTLTVSRQSGDTPQGRVLQMWLLTEDQPPHAVGILPDAGELVVPVIPFWGQRIPTGRFAISVEPPGGSTDSVGPTGEILAVGEVQEI